MLLSLFASLEVPGSHVKVFSTQNTSFLYCLPHYIITERKHQVDKDNGAVGYVEDLVLIERDSYHKRMPEDAKFGGIEAQNLQSILISGAYAQCSLTEDCAVDTYPEG